MIGEAKVLRITNHDTPKTQPSAFRTSLNRVMPSFFRPTLPLLALLVWSTARAQETPAKPAANAQQAPVSFVKDLVPILADKCLTCHQETKARGKYRVDHFEKLLKAGNSEEIPITAGDLANSYFYHLLITEDADERMPLDDDPLPEAQVNLFKRWIEEGAKFDGPDPKAPLVTLRETPKSSVALGDYKRPVTITALTFHRDPAHWYSNGQGELLQWNTETSALKRRYAQQPERIYKISFHPTQPWVAVAGGIPGKLGEAVVTHLETGKILFRTPAVADCLHAVEFSPDGKWLATGGTDKAVRVYATSDWKQVWRTEAHADWIMDLCFSPDSQWILSASRDRTVRSYQSKDGEQGISYTTHTFPVTQVMFDADPNYVLSTTSDGQGRRWKFTDLRDNKRFISVRSEVTQLKRLGDLVYVGFANGEVHRFNFKNTKQNARFKTKMPRIFSLAAQPESERLFLGGASGKVLITTLGKLDQDQTIHATPGWKE